MTHLAALALRPPILFGPRQKIYAHHCTIGTEQLLQKTTPEEVRFQAATENRQRKRQRHITLV